MELLQNCDFMFGLFCGVVIEGVIMIVTNIAKEN